MDVGDSLGISCHPMSGHLLPPACNQFEVQLMKVFGAPALRLYLPRLWRDSGHMDPALK